MGPDWSIASEQPPTKSDDDRRRVDIRVDRWKAHRQPKWCTIMFFEAKKAMASASEIDTLEIQAYNACITYLTATGRDQIYAATAIGTSIRLWYVSLTGAAYLQPFVPPDREFISEKTSYIEAYTSDAQLIVNGIRTIIANDEGIMLRSSKPAEAAGPSGSTNPIYGGPSAAGGAETAGVADDHAKQGYHQREAESEDPMTGIDYEMQQGEEEELEEGEDIVRLCEGATKTD